MDSHIADDRGADKCLVHHNQGRTVGGLPQLLLPLLEHLFGGCLHRRPKLAVQRVAVMMAELVDDNGQYGVSIVGDVSTIIHLAAADDGAQCVSAVFQFGAAPVVVRTH